MNCRNAPKSGRSLTVSEMVWNEPQRAQDIACPAIVLETESGERRSDISGPQREALAREEDAQATSGLAARGEDLSDVMRGSRVPRPSLRNKWKVFSTRLACQREMRPSRSYSQAAVLFQDFGWR